MVTVCSYMLMETDTKGIGLMIRDQALEKLSMLIVMFMKEISKMTHQVVVVLYLTAMETVMKVNGTMVLKKAKE